MWIYLLYRQPALYKPQSLRNSNNGMCKTPTTSYTLCFLPCRSHVVVSGELSYLSHLEYWKQHGFISLVHMSVVTEYSLCWLCRLREALASFMVIYNLVRSCLSCWRWRLLSSLVLFSETDTCLVSWWQKPHTPPRFRGKGQPEGGGHRDGCLLTSEGEVNKNKVWRKISHVNAKKDNAKQNNFRG